MPNKQNVSPAIQVGDKIVQVGPLDWPGVTAMAGALDQAQLALPDLQVDGIRQQLTTLRQQEGITVANCIGLAYEFVAANLPTVYQWILKHPPLVQTFVVQASNVTPDEVAKLSAGETLRVARAAWRALVEDGFFREAGGFFGELLGLRAAESAGPATQPTNEHPESSAVSAAA